MPLVIGYDVDGETLCSRCCTDTSKAYPIFGYTTEWDPDGVSCYSCLESIIDAHRVSDDFKTLGTTYIFVHGVPTELVLKTVKVQASVLYFAVTPDVEYICTLNELYQWELQQVRTVLDENNVIHGYTDYAL